jgi:uncharacterized membrane protein YobD (UPF0266 family)
MNTMRDYENLHTWFRTHFYLALTVSFRLRTKSFLQIISMIQENFTQYLSSSPSVSCRQLHVMLMLIHHFSSSCGVIAIRGFYFLFYRLFFTYLHSPLLDLTKQLILVRNTCTHTLPLSLSLQDEIYLLLLSSLSLFLSFPFFVGSHR